MKTINSPKLLDIFSQNKKKDKEVKKTETIEKIIIDYREKNSLIASHLIKLGIEVEFKELKIGDYIVRNIVIERKTVSDFISSMINKRLLKQIEELKQYPNKLLIVEGISEKELYSSSEKEGGMNPNAIRGFLLSILLKHKIPVLFTKNSEDTAKFMNILFKKKEKEINLNAKKKTLSKKEQLQFIIESFPGIGPKKSKKLLEKFGSIQNIILAPTEELKKILGEKAKQIRKIIEEKY
ncbi:MAG TPA: ERCC4 domain-containing protein [Candidatus Pacearchaeota archaeon]|nr:ERCC4 domain-containing protein [Candidatus Pacearchaeota archaeon]